MKALEEADLMGEGCGGIECGKAGEGAGLVGVEEAAGPGHERETGGGDPLNDLREGSWAKKEFSPGATVVASRRKRCALSFLLASTAYTWSQHPGCAQEPPEQHHTNGLHLLHPEGQLCTWYTRRHPGNQPIRGTYWATN